MEGNDMGGLESAERVTTIASDESSEDQPILEALATGDRRLAVSLCCERHGGAIGRFCMSLLGSQSESEDMVQETLLIAHGSFDSYRKDAGIRAWLFGIARRRCAKLLERNRRRSTLRLVEPVDTEPNGEELLIHRRRTEATRRALDALKPSDREALLLRYQAGLSYRELALDFSIEEAAARQRVSRALFRFSEILRGEGMTHD